MVLWLNSSAVRTAIHNCPTWSAIAAALLVSAVAAPAQGQSFVTLAWDASSSSGIAGYRLYVGGTSHIYTNVVTVRNATTGTVTGLIRGGTYFSAVTSYNTDGIESEFSTEITFTIPLGNNIASSMELTSPASGAVYTAPATIQISAAVTTGAQKLMKVEFYNGATLLGTATGAPYSFSWNQASAGNYTLQAVAVYDSGSTLASAVVPVTVVAAQPPPELTFTADSGITAAPLVAKGETLAQAIETSVTNGGLALYTFHITNAGNYTVSAVVSAPNEGQNSFYVNIDAEPVDPLMIWDIPLCTRPLRHTVSWRGNGGPAASLAQYNPKVFTLSAGMHQLVIRGREANTMLGAITIAAVPPSLKIQKAANGAVVLSGTGQPNQPYKVLCSEDSAAWRTIGAVTTDPTGVFQFSDPAAGSQSIRMYRLLSVSVTSTRLRIGDAAGGFVTLNAEGQAGGAFTVLRSLDLKSWTGIGTMTLNGAGRGEFTDPVARGRLRGFYRLQEQ